MRVCVCVCVRMRMLARAAKLGLDVCSVIFCLCLCARMFHRRSLVSALEMESKRVAKCHVELCQYEMYMRVRQVGCDQGCCDVGVGMCVCARVCLGVFLCVMRMYHGCFSRSIL